MNAEKSSAATDKIRERFLKIKTNLSERSRRLFVANEAIAFGYGGIAAASAVSPWLPIRSL
jgi:hypothetical protein